MASKDFSILEMQNEDDEINLQFQDFQANPTNATDSNSKEQTIYFSNFPETAEDQEQQLLGETNSPSKSTHSFWQFEYYQQYFDVESKQVSDRILWSMFPKPGIDYLQSYIRPNPDLYGPFWICTTLVMTTAIMGNIANYLQNEDTSHWKYDFHKVSLAASAVFSYAWLVPIIVWGVLLWRGSRTDMKLLELICLYGYSLSVYIPVSILWTIPVPWLQWCLGIVATVLSGSVLVRAILPAISHESKKIAIVLSVVVLILHGVLAISFMMYFFHIPTSDQHAPSVAPSVVLPTQPNVLPVNDSDPKGPAVTITKRSHLEDKIIPGEPPDPKLAPKKPSLSAKQSDGTVIKPDSQKTVKVAQKPTPVKSSPSAPVKDDPIKP